jgi:hypothetical protein
MMRTLQRVVALCFIIAFSTFLFYVGREHQIFIDNKTIELENSSFRALKFIRVSVNDGTPIELMARDRDLMKVVGPSFRFKLEVLDEYGEEVENIIEKDLRLDFTKDIMLSMPIMAAGREDYILPPPTIQTSPPEQDPPTVEEQMPIMDANDPIL